jgi:hypothetical protein
MDVAALITWLIAAIGGFVLLGTWIANGGLRRDVGRPSRLPPGVVFGHFLLAAAGLVLWVIYLVADSDSLTWVAFVAVAVAALLGFVMFFRWLPQIRARRTVAATAGARAADATAESQFPVAVVVAHGLFAAATVVLVLLAALSA